MAKAGRKRKQGERHPSGDLILERATAPAAIRRLREAALAGMQDSRWGTEAGRLLLLGRLTDKQYEAGCRWMTLYQRASSAMQSRPHVLSASDYNRSSGAASDPDSERGIEEAKRHLKDMETYQKALVKLAAHGPITNRALVTVFERNEMLADNLKFLTCGLDTLAEFFGLTTERKSAPLGNR